MGHQNVGVGRLETSMLETSNENFKRVMDTNLYGGFLGAKHAARVMILVKKGCIIFTASTMSVMGGFTDHSNVASKHTVVGLTKNLSVEMGRYEIRVNCISPNAVATLMLTKETGLEKEALESLLSKAGNLTGEVLEAEDVAATTLYLIGDESKYVTGVNLMVDGRFTITNP